MHSRNQAATERIHQGAQRQMKLQSRILYGSERQDAKRGAEFNAVQDQRVLGSKT